MAHGIWRDFLVAAWQALWPRSPHEAAQLESERGRGAERLAEDTILRTAAQRRRVTGKR